MEPEYDNWEWVVEGYMAAQNKISCCDDERNQLFESLAFYLFQKNNSDGVWE